MRLPVSGCSENCTSHRACHRHDRSFCRDAALNTRVCSTSAVHMLTCTCADRRRANNLLDSEAVIADSLECDWKWATDNKLDQFIAKADAHGKTEPTGAAGAAACARVKETLKELYGMVLGIFDYYASAGSDLDVYTIGLNEYNMFLMECEIPVPGSADCGKQHLEQVCLRYMCARFFSRIACLLVLLLILIVSCVPTPPCQLFVAIDSGQKVKEKFNVKHALSRQEFLQVLVRTAVLRYIKPRKAGETPMHTDVSEAVRELILNQMKPRVGPGALQVSNDFRQKCLYIQETDAVLAQHESTLQALYDVYSDEQHATHDLAAVTNMLGFNEWLNLCTHLQLVDEEFTIREMTNCFMWARMRVADETNIVERRKMCNLRFGARRHFFLFPPPRFFEPSPPHVAEGTRSL